MLGKRNVWGRRIALAMAALAVVQVTGMSAGSAIGALTISGTVTLGTGAPLSGASLTDGAGNSATTAANGTYQFQETNTGNYQISVVAPGFASQTKTAALSLTQPNATANFTMLYISTVKVPGGTNLTTASGPQTVNVDVTTAAPNPGTSGQSGKSCAYVTDTRTGQTSAMTSEITGPTNVLWNWGEALVQATTEGAFAFSTRVVDCASSAPIDTGTQTNYVVDNTPPVLSQLLPANLGNVLANEPITLSAFASDAGSGVNSKSATLILDGSPVTPNVSAAGGGVVVSFVPTSGLSPGRHSLEAKVADAAGNVQLANWSFNVTSLFSSATAVLTDHSDGTTTPPTPGLNQTVTMSNVLLDLGQTSVSMPSSGHPGFGLLCGTIDLSSLVAVFPNAVPGQPSIQQGPSSTPTDNVVCTYISDLATDPSAPYSELLAGWATNLGNVTFPVPNGAALSASVTLTFTKPPTVKWLDPKYSVGAGGGTTENVFDPVPNVIDAPTAAAAQADLSARQASFISADDLAQGTDIEPSQWAQSGGKYGAVSPAVDHTRMFTAAQYGASLTPSSGYVAGAPGSLLYREVLSFEPTPQAVTGTASTVESYFRWDSSYTGTAGQATFLPLTWTTAGSGATGGSSYHVFDANGTDVSATPDDAGHPIAWSTYSPNGASGTYGSVLGLEQGFDLGGAADSVRSGYLDQTIPTSTSQACTYGYCTASYATAIQDPNPADTFAVTAAPAVAPSGSSAVAQPSNAPTSYQNCVTESGSATTCKSAVGSAPPSSVSLSVSATSVAAGTAVTLTANTPTDVGPSPYYIEIANTAGQMVGICGTGTSCSVIQSESPQTQVTEQYIALVAGYDNTYSPPNHPPEVQDQSGTQSVTWTNWTVSLQLQSADPIPTGYPASLVATTDGNVASAGYYIDIYDTTTNTLVASANSGSNLTASVSEASSVTHSFVAYVASSAPSSGSPSNPAATSTSQSETWQSSLWSVQLASSTNQTSVGGNIAFTATSNYSVTPTPFYLDIYDETATVPVMYCGSGTSCVGSEQNNSAGTHDFFAYVADMFAFPGTVGQVGTEPPPNIQATSSRVTASWGYASPHNTTPPPVERSFYIAPSDTYNLEEQRGCSQAQADILNLRNSVVILDFGGEAADRQGTLSTVQVNGSYVEMSWNTDWWLYAYFAAGYQSCADGRFHETLAYGTNNSANYVNGAGGYDVGKFVAQAAANLYGWGYNETVVYGGNDVEAAYSTYPAFSNWELGDGTGSGYASESGSIPMIDFGDAECPPYAGTTYYNGGDMGCTNGWSFSEVYNAAWGFGPNFAAPEVYYAYDVCPGYANMAVQWENVSEWGANNAGPGRIYFLGPLDQGYCLNSGQAWNELATAVGHFANTSVGFTYAMEI